MTIYNFPFDLIDAFTREVLPYCISGITTWREEISSVLIVYSIRDNELGDLGIVRLRKLINGGTEIIFTYPPSPDYLDIYNWIKQRNGQVQIGKTQLRSVKEQIPPELFDQVMKLAKTQLIKIRETRNREVMDAFFNRLNQEQSLRLEQEKLEPKQIEETKDSISITPTSDLQAKEIGTKRLIDQACIDWAGRGYVPRVNQSEFLSEFFKETKIFLSIDQFKDALKDAGRRGLIMKINKRWRLPEKST